MRTLSNDFLKIINVLPRQWALWSLCLSPAIGVAATLTPQVVVDRVMEHSQEAKEIAYEKQLAETQWYKERNVFDPVLKASTDYTLSQADQLTTTTVADEQKNFNYSLGLAKTFASGTTVDFSYGRESVSYLWNPLTASDQSIKQRTLDLATFKFTQELWRNSFGLEDRLSVQSARKTIVKAGLKKLENLEELVLTSLTQYWTTYVAKENLRASMDSRKRYEKLVRSIKQKARMGFTQPGDLPFAQAELESKYQQVKRQSADYLNQLDELLRLIQWPSKETAEEFDFKVDSELPEPVQASSPNLDQLRPIMIAKESLTIAKNNLRATQSRHHPRFNLVAKTSLTGGNEEASEAFAEVMGTERPLYYIGLELEHTLDSSSKKGELQEARVTLAKEETALKKAKDVLDKAVLEQERQVHSLYLIAESTVKTIAYRKQALKELERSYRQGRTDLDQLVKAYNNLELAETEKILALGNYYIALNTLAAIRDELIAQEVE